VASLALLEGPAQFEAMRNMQVFLLNQNSEQLHKCRSERKILTAATVSYLRGTVAVLQRLHDDAAAVGSPPLTPNFRPAQDSVQSIAGALMNTLEFLCHGGVDFNPMRPSSNVA